MSELSAYRLGAQNYIDAKKRGEIPPPPKHTLPGYKAKSETEPENKTTEESADYVPSPLNSRMKPKRNNPSH